MEQNPTWHLSSGWQDVDQNARSKQQINARNLQTFNIYSDPAVKTALKLKYSGIDCIVFPSTRWILVSVQQACADVEAHMDQKCKHLRTFCREQLTPSKSPQSEPLLRLQPAQSTTDAACPRSVRSHPSVDSFCQRRGGGEKSLFHFPPPCLLLSFPPSSASSAAWAERPGCDFLSAMRRREPCWEVWMH